MPNIALVLKGEIARIARKELKSQAQEIKKAAAAHRAQIAALRGRIDTLERQLRKATKSAGRAPVAAEAEDDADERRHRFSAKGFATQRQRLGLSAAAMATLLGVSGQSVYKWELGKARPRAKQLEAIAALRGIGKREALARLEALGGSNEE